MATTSSSSSCTYERKYDVFISFRGVDTRRGFTGNLVKALRETKEVKVFMDDQDLEPGAEITPALFKAIQESRIALVIFSKNYAASNYCLEELAYIMECSNENGMLVWPVFYHVDPAEVRHHKKGSYAEALAKHEARNYGRRKPERWRWALETAANLSGKHLRLDTDKYEYEYIDEIVQKISEKISSLRDGDMNQLQPKPQSSTFKHRQVQDTNQPKGLKSLKGKKEAQLEMTQEMQISYHCSYFQQPKPQSSRFKYQGEEHLPKKQVHNYKQPKPQSSSFSYQIEHLPEKSVHSNKQPKTWSSNFSYQIEHLPDKGVHTKKQRKPQSSRFTYEIDDFHEKWDPTNKSPFFSFEVSMDGDARGYFPGVDPDVMSRNHYTYPPFPRPEAYSFSSDEEENDNYPPFPPLESCNLFSYEEESDEEENDEEEGFQFSDLQIKSL